jgi:hypothetical protein
VPARFWAVSNQPMRAIPATSTIAAMRR